LARRFQHQDPRFELAKTRGRGVATVRREFIEARFKQADASDQAYAEDDADNAGNGNDHRGQHEDRDQAFQDRIPCSVAVTPR
jgi:hypothetical protein